MRWRRDTQQRGPKAMTRSHSYGRSLLAAAVFCLAGCHQWPRSPAHQKPSTRAGGEPEAAITRAQEADMQVAMGRMAERQGNPEQAMAAYHEALKRDKGRADAYQRLAILHDRKGEFRQSADLYRQALEADPGNPDIFCDQGYSLYLQRRWADAEMSVRQAITLRPEDPRAHNNLGMILAHAGRHPEALAEFRKAGASRADAHNNLAFALTTDGRWADARAQYRLALAADSTSERARGRLRELDTLLAKADSRRSAAPQLAGGEAKQPATPHDRQLLPASATAPAPSPAPRRTH